MKNEAKINRPVSRVLSSSRISGTSSIIYLDPISLTGSSNLPSGIERAALMLRFIWSFNSQGLPFCYVAIAERELLPHIFTISPYVLRQAQDDTGLLFSVALAVSVFMRNLPVRKWDALCCPDFPLSRIYGTAIERPVHYKDTRFLDKLEMTTKD